MEFDDADEEMPLPVASGYDPSSLDNSSTPADLRKSTATTAGAAATAAGTRYRECLKNHAVGIGGHAVDGCGEFMPAGEDGTLDALRCAACNCHRNFHRKETAAAGDGAASAYHHPQFSPYYRTPAGYLQHHHHLAAAAAAGGSHHYHRPAPTPPPLALPSTSGGGGRSGDEEDFSNPMMMGGGGGGGMMMMGGGASGSGSKKRFRTKFTAEQKDKMLAFAESAGWRIQKQDEAAVQQLCNETGVKRHVLKVWMHNNKHTLGKKP